jgi:hypothetical protein
MKTRAKTVPALLGIFAMTLALAVQVQAQSFLTNGLVAYYPFNGNANDESGNGNAGTVIGATLTTDRFGKANTAYNFNGSDDYIEIPETLFGPAVIGFTFSAWIRTDSGSYPSGYEIIYKGASNGQAELKIDTNTLRFGACLQNSSWWWADAPLPTNAFAHVVGVYKKGERVEIWVNGSLMDSKVPPNESLIQVVGYYSAIGAFRMTGSIIERFRGVIEDVRIYDRALSDSEVQQLYAYESASHTSPVQWPIGAGGNGHFYEPVLVPGGIDWESANSAAVARGGYLATTASPEENSFVFGLVSNDPRFWVPPITIGPWLGGFQPPGSPEPAGNWQWITGEPFDYTNWETGEPSNSGTTGEDRIVMWGSRGPPKEKWDDLYAFETENRPVGYIVEYSTGPTVVRQPASQVGYWGKNISFIVRAVGEPSLSYQWQKDTVPIAGATGSSLVLTNLQATNAGNYSVVVTNTYGSTTSSDAYLTVNPAGVSLALYSGITIDGVVGLTYGIQYSTDLSNTNAWRGMANVTLSVPTELWFDVQPANEARRYYRVVPGPIPVP